MSPAEHLLKSLYVMASMVEARDPYTGGHLWRVSQYSLLLARQAGLDDATTARVALGGFLHDLGKIGIPDAILNKPGKLTDEEYEIIRTHPRVGHRLIEEHALGGLAHDAVLHYHETPNGRGYPGGLRAGAIPLDARIVGVADAFDAMTSNRPYRRGMPIERALAIIEENSGSQFDPEFADHLVALGRRGVLAHIAGHSESGIPLQPCPMCGPTIVVRRAHRHHDRLYCRNCGGEVELERSATGLSVRPTGRRGNPAELEPDIDHALIDELVAQAGACLHQSPALGA